MKRSLRRQIFLWYVLIIPLLILGVVFISHQVMVASLRDALDDRLVERSQVVAKAVLASPAITTEGYEDLIEWLTEEQLPYVPAILRISDPQGNELAIFGDVPDPMFPIMDEQIKLAVTSEGRFETARIRGHEALRLYTVRMFDTSEEYPIIIIQTGDSLAQAGAAQGQLWIYALAVGVIGSLVALLVGRLILQRGFRPLDSILNQIQDVESKNLTVRLPEESRPLEIQQLADTLNNMLERLDDAFRTRETFVASVSHDLRTPLTALQGQIEVLLMEYSASSEMKQSLERMARETSRLIRLSNNLLLDVQLESKLVLVDGEVNLTELLDEVAREVKVLAEGLNFKVSVCDMAVVIGNYDLLKQMLLNVVDNAIKFTPKGGSVELVLSQEEEYAVVRVSDTGQGMSPEHLPHITEPFYKVKAGPKSRVGGAGLGLAIVRRVIDLHGGQISIQSKEGTGTTVTMRLPIMADTGSVTTE